jgi:hypothetical protein
MQAVKSCKLARFTGIKVSLKEALLCKGFSREGGYHFSL